MNTTVIPDIHADMQRLNWSLNTSSTSSELFFLGDLIDAGKGVKKPNDLGVLKKVRQFISTGKAKAVLGNHELNAILFHRISKDYLVPMRPHTENNMKQHKSFIKAFGIQSPEALDWTLWMLDNMPLWHEVDGLRIVHACWSESAIQIVKKRRPDGYLLVEDLDEIAARKTRFAKAVELLTSGPEFSLPEGYMFDDKNGKTRKEVRLKWWDPEVKTWDEACLSVPDTEQLPKTKLPTKALKEIYDAKASPALVGHYKMKGEPHLQSSNASSLDFPDTPCLYAWRGEKSLIPENLITTT